MIAVVIACGTGCTIADTRSPSVSGPSELAVAIALQATPDVVVRDGTSQAIVAVLVRDANGQPIAALDLRADIVVDGVVRDFGKLSARSLTTARDGQASVVYTSPAYLPGTTGQTVVTIAITPSTGDARSQVARTVDIRLVPPPDP